MSIVYTDYKRLQDIGKMFGMTEEKVRAILDVYFATSLHNMLISGEDKNIFGTMVLDEDLNLKLLRQSPEMDQILSGRIDIDNYLRLLENGRNRE